MIRKFMAAFAVMAALAVAPPAQAAPVTAPPAAVVQVQAQAQAAAWSDCYGYPGTICLAAHANWGNPVWRQYPSQIDGCEALYGFNDITTMAVNNADDWSLTLYEHGTCTGNRLLIVSGQAYDFSGTFRNDMFSAVRVTYHG
jgi:hypothetical protein